MRRPLHVVVYEIARESLDRESLSPAHPLGMRLTALRERLDSDALVWFRTCETLGARPGHDFAQALGDRPAVPVGY